MSRINSALCALAMTMLTAALARCSTPPVDRPPRKLEMLAGQGQVFDFDSAVARVYSSNTEVADPAVFTEREVLLNAKAPGIATVVVWLQSGVRETFSVRVELDLESVRVLLRETFPGEDIALHGSKEGLSLVGRASTQEISDRAVALLKPLAQSVVSNLQISPRVLRQIGLKVIFAEVNRKATQEFGINILSTGGAMPGAISTGQFPGAGLTTAGTGLNLSDALNVFALRPDLNLAVTIKALEQQGLLQILAEPNLVTSDGKEARFMVGGEFPVPVPQAGSAAGAITIQFREFGIRLSFLPTLTPNGTVRLHVLPEVSSIDIVNAITLNGFNIPALSTRRVETDVELEQGQSFVIAGLVDDRVTENLSRVPGLSDIPLFGALFKSRQRLKSKTELVVLVTPTVRHPLGSGEDPPLPAMPVPFLPPTENSSALNSPYLQQLQHTLIHSLIEMFESGSPHNPAAPVAQQTAAGQRPSDILIRHFQDLSLRYGSEHPDVRKAADVAALALDMEEEAEQEKTNHEKK